MSQRSQQYREKLLKQFKKWLNGEKNCERELTFTQENYSTNRRVRDDSKRLNFEVADRDAPPILVSNSELERPLCIQEVKISGNQPIIFKNCFIEVIELVGQHRKDPIFKPASARITLIDCYVHRIKFGKNQFEDFEMKGGGLFRIDGLAQAASKENAFTGRVTIKDVWLPRKSSQLERRSDDTDEDFQKEYGGQSEREKQIYEYRNIRMYLAKKGDVQPAGIFHSAELSLEREEEVCASKVLNFLYWQLSDYGNSIGRPLASVSFIYTLLVASATFPLGDPSVVAVGCVVDVDAVNQAKISSDLIGWHRELCNHPFLRALVFSLYSIFNPLGLLSTKQLFIAVHWEMAAIHSALSLVGAASIALLVLAIRRRFKLEKPD